VGKIGDASSGLRLCAEGSVRRPASRVRIKKVIEAASGKHVWATITTRELADVFCCADEISSEHHRRDRAGIMPRRSDSASAKDRISSIAWRPDGAAHCYPPVSPR